MREEPYFARVTGLVLHSEALRATCQEVLFVAGVAGTEKSGLIGVRSMVEVCCPCLRTL